MSIENRQDEREQEENSGQPGSNRGQNICGLRAENILRHTAAERSAEPFAFRSLHENNEDHEQPNDDLEREQEVDQKRHKGWPISSKSRVCK